MSGLVPECLSVPQVVLAATSELQLLLKFHGKVLEILGSAGPAHPRSRAPLSPFYPIPMNKSPKSLLSLQTEQRGLPGQSSSIDPTFPGPGSLQGLQHESLSLIFAFLFPDFSFFFFLR